MDAWIAVASLVIMVGVAGYLVWSLFKSISDERRRSGVRGVWKNFGLGVVLCILFLVSWGAQALSQWQAFRDEQQEHGQRAEASAYLVDFAQATFENWQSEFLQLFAFVVLASLLIHRGSAESRDSDDRIEEMLKEIKSKLDA